MTCSHEGGKSSKGKKIRRVNRQVELTTALLKRKGKKLGILWGHKEKKSP